MLNHCVNTVLERPKTEKPRDPQVGAQTVEQATIPGPEQQAAAVPANVENTLDTATDFAG